MGIIKICGILLLCGAGGMILREAKASSAQLLILGALLLSGILSLKLMEPMVGELSALVAGTAAERCFPVMLRALGIGLIAEFSASAVREMGYASLGQEVERLAKLLILSQALPLMKELISGAKAFIGA